jgi:hypothetical protein
MKKTLATLATIGALALGSGCGKAKEPIEKDYMNDAVNTIAHDSHGNSYFVFETDSRGIPSDVRVNQLHFITQEYAKEHYIPKYSLGSYKYRELTPGMKEAMVDLQKATARFTYEVDKSIYDTAMRSRSNEVIKMESEK